jgi:hypothetical protein
MNFQKNSQTNTQINTQTNTQINTQTNTLMNNEINNLKIFGCCWDNITLKKDYKGTGIPSRATGWLLTPPRTSR